MIVPVEQTHSYFSPFAMHKGLAFAAAEDELSVLVGAGDAFDEEPDVVSPGDEELL